MKTGYLLKNVFQSKIVQEIFFFHRWHILSRVQADQRSKMTKLNGDKLSFMNPMNII